MGREWDWAITMPIRMTLQQQLESALSYQRAGRLAEAEALYRQILSQQPNHPDALHRLGILAGQSGHRDAAVDLIRRAIRAKPDWAEAYGNLGNILQDAGQLDEAVTSYRRAISLKPDLAGAHSNLGNTFRSLGQLDEAIASYREAIQLKPDFAEAHSNLGNAMKDIGQLDEAIASFRQAIQFKPSFAEAHNNLGSALAEKGQLEEAITAYRDAIRIRPDYAGAHYNLGIALRAKGQVDEAIGCYRQAIQLKPDYCEAYNNLGSVLSDMGQFDEAILFFRQAIRLKPDFAEAHSNLGNALKEKGELDAAIASHRHAIGLKPDYAEAHNNLGGVLSILGRFDEAIASFGQAISLKPGFAEAHNNLGSAMKDNGQLDEAIASYRHAIGLKPDYAEAHSNLGSALMAIGRLDEAIVSYREAIRLRPDCAKLHSNLVLTLHYHSGYDARMIYDELCRGNRQYAEPLKKLIQPHINNRDSDRRLRIGYVSPGFGDHPVGWFLLPLLANHDHQRVEVFGYAQVPAPDKMTQRLRSHAEAWRSLVGLTDAQAADLIRRDQIDILVDLALHTADNRLPVFAHKPAPVQVTYLAYSGSSGLTTMDYRLSDSYLDPPGEDESVYSEETIRLPETYWCYQPVVDLPLQPLPALEKGFITFGCLNNFSKVNEPLLSLWARVLAAVPRSRLLLHTYEGSHRQRVLEQMQREGIDPERVSFAGKVPLTDYFKRYQSIDIALDTLPYGGGTTTCDTLWMGVPMVSLAGKTAVGRAGSSILSVVGVPELIARTPEQYIQIVTDLAGDLPRLVELRRALRSRMQESPLMNAPRFARNIEAAYRQMWRNWCEAGGKSRGV
jgi:protein O-GlcNAc transferase